MTDAARQTILHASAVAWDGRALLIEGPSGSGKSALCLELMARGATLVSDDRVVLDRQGDQVLASPPEAIAGRIEARGMGILNAAYERDIPVAAVVILSEMETDRLPPRRSKNLLGICLPMLHNTGTAYFAAALLQYLNGGRHA